jgi:hypothetical protein
VDTATLEIKYRSAQRQLGEIDVACRLMADLLRKHPEDQSLMQAIVRAKEFRSSLFRRVTALERRLFGVAA